MLAISRRHDNPDAAGKKRGVGIVVSMLWSAITVLPAAAYAQVIGPPNLGQNLIIGPTDLGQNLPPAIPFVYNPVTGYVAPWLGNVTGAANTLFIILFTIELFIFGLQAILFKKENHLGDLFSGIALKTLGSGFILFLINGAPLIPHFLPLVTQSMGQLGQNVVGTTTSMNSLLITGNGAAAQFLSTADTLHADDVYNASHLGLFNAGTGQLGLGVTAAIGNLIDECVLTAMALIIVAGMAAVFMTWVGITMETVIVLSGGIIFLGFAGTRFTMQFAQGYLRYVVAVGAKLLVFWLVVTMENNILGGDGTTAVHTALQGLQQLVQLGKVAIDGQNNLGQAGNPGCNAMTASQQNLICPIQTNPNPNSTQLMSDLLPIAYVAFEFLLMGIIAYTIPLFAGRFFSGAALMWRNIDGADTTHAVSINEFRANISTLLSMRAKHTLGTRSKDDASPAARAGASGFTTDAVTPPVNTIFAASANLGSSPAANPLLSQNGAFKSMSPSVTAGTFTALHPRNAIELASVSRPILGSASEPSIDGVGEVDGRINTNASATQGRRGATEVGGRIRDSVADSTILSAGRLVADTYPTTVPLIGTTSPEDISIHSSKASSTPTTLGREESETLPVVGATFEEGSMGVARRSPAAEVFGASEDLPSTYSSHELSVQSALGDPSERTPLKPIMGLEEIAAENAPEPSVSLSISAVAARPRTWSTAVTRGIVDFTSTEIADMQPVEFYKAFRDVDFRDLTQAQIDAIRGREDLSKIAGLLVHDFQGEPPGSASRGAAERPSLHVALARPTATPQVISYERKALVTLHAMQAGITPLRALRKGAGFVDVSVVDEFVLDPLTTPKPASALESLAIASTVNEFPPSGVVNGSSTPDLLLPEPGIDENQPHPSDE